MGATRQNGGSEWSESLLPIVVSTCFPHSRSYSHRRDSGHCLRGLRCHANASQTCSSESACFGTASVLFRLTRSEEPSLAAACDSFAARAQLLLGLIPGEVGMIVLETLLMLVSSVPIPSSPRLIVREFTFTYSTRINLSSVSGAARQCCKRLRAAWYASSGAVTTAQGRFPGRCILVGTSRLSHPKIILALLHVGQGRFASLWASANPDRRSLRSNPAARPNVRLLA